MPSGVLLAVRLLLIAVFVRAGAGKLIDRAGSREALVDFGVPERLTPTAAILLPVAELAVAVTLVVTSSARAGAVGALLLLAVFSAAIAANLAAGRTPDCHCFGQAHASPIGAASLARNVALGAVSGLVVWQGPGLGVGDALARIGDLSATQRAALGAVLVLGIVVAVQGWFLLQLLRQQGRLLLRLEVVESSFGEEEGMARRAPAPDFTLESVTGESVSLGGLIAEGRVVLLVFTSSRCRPCTALFPEIGRWQREDGSALTVAVLASGDAAANQAKAVKERVARVLVDEDGAVAKAYRAQATPGAVLVGTDGRLQSVVAVGADPIRGLVVRAVDTGRRMAARPHQTHAEHNGAGDLTAVHAGASPTGTRRNA